MRAAKILIVEDDVVVADQIRRDLKKMDYHVCSLASSGKEAIRIVENEKPDLVLMDIMLSQKMDGIETARHISSRFQIPVIYLSGYTDDDYLQRAKETEPFGYLVKPFRSRELQLNVEMALHKHGMQVQRDVLVGDIRKNVELTELFSELLSVCMHCKKVNDKHGSWGEMEEYVQNHFNVKISHGVCPSCVDNLYTEKDGEDTDRQV